MSDKKAAYEHFSPLFYERLGDDAEMVSQAEAISSMIESYLYAYGANEIWELPPEVQDYVNQNAKIRIDLGAAHD